MSILLSAKLAVGATGVYRIARSDYAEENAAASDRLWYALTERQAIPAMSAKHPMDPAHAVAAVAGMMIHLLPLSQL